MKKRKRKSKSKIPVKHRRKAARKYHRVRKHVRKHARAKARRHNPEYDSRRFKIKPAKWPTREEIRAKSESEAKKRGKVKSRRYVLDWASSYPNPGDSWTYLGEVILPADRNSSGIRWWTLLDNGENLRSDTKEGMKQLINAAKKSESRKKSNPGSAHTTSPSGKIHYSYNTAILDVLPDGRTIGNATKYSVTTSRHQREAGVPHADIKVAGVPVGTRDLVAWYKAHGTKSNPRRRVWSAK